MQVTRSAQTLKESAHLTKISEIISAEELYDKYAPFLFSLISKIIPENKKAEETLVEAFVYIDQHLSNFKPTQGPLKIWLMNNARNIALNVLCDMQDHYPCNRKFKNFSLAEKTVFALYYFRSFSIIQIVEVVGLSAPIVEKLLRSAEVKAND